MVDIPSVSTVIASAGVFEAAVYHIFQIRHQARMRQTDLVMRLYSTYCRKEFAEAVTRYLTADFRNYDKLVEKYSSIPIENPVQIASNDQS